MDDYKATDFIREKINQDLKTNKYDGRVMTRFPPEPNGYLHIGHAKSICLNFGIAKEYQDAVCNLRFDDTNPTKEDTEYVESIQEDVKWLGFDWEDRLYFASDYFEQLYQYAIDLIKLGKAYVCSLTLEEVRAYRGTVTEPGKESPYRNRSIEENLDLFSRMRDGEFADGAHTLRAKIDMASQHMIMRDPPLYRIRKAYHHRTGDQWCLYPMYDFAHCLSDSIEGITHSLCTLEFENNRVLYDWVLDELKLKSHPQQIEFARLNITHTLLSKRKLLELVKDHHVDGWDDPRMPTISGLRRRGYTPKAIRNFCEKVGITKKEGMVDVQLLEHCLREDLNQRAPRFMGVLNPLKVVIVNYPEDQEELLEAINNPEDDSMGIREIKFSKVIYIEKDDFMENPPKKYFRLSPGNEIRLRYAYYITCVDVIKNNQGEILEIHCTYDPQTKGGDSPDGRKVKGTSHWVSAKHALSAQVRLYNHLFTIEDFNDAEKDKDYKEYLNSQSKIILKDCFVEPEINKLKPYDFFQFERLGYFCIDTDSSSENLIINRSVTLKDTWAKAQK